MSDLIATISAEQTLSGNTSIGRGVDGESVFIKYSDVKPTKDNDLKDEIGDWIGIYRGRSAPESYFDYQWYCLNNLFPINEFLDFGDVSANKDNYNVGSAQGYMTVFISNMVKTIAGKVCLDCFFSDFEYPNATRENNIVVPSIAGRNIYSGHRFMAKQQ